MTTSHDRTEPQCDLDALDRVRPSSDPAPIALALAGCEETVLKARDIVERTGLADLVVLLRIRMGFPRETFDLTVRPLIDGYAEFVQLLPVTGSRRYGEPGGQLRRALTAAMRALDRRRGQILPRGAPPEVIGALAHRWTYAVLVAALLRDSSQVCAGIRVWVTSGGGCPRPWDSREGSLFACGAERYSVELAASADTTGASKVATQVFKRCVPPVILNWLQDDPALMSELQSVLDGRAEPGSAIAELVWLPSTGQARGATPAAQSEPALDPAEEEGTPAEASAPRSVKSPEGAEPEYLEDVSAEVPALARQFMAWLREGISVGTIEVNQPKAFAYVVAEGLLLVSPQIFREFERAGLAPEPALDADKRVQREVLRAGWHLRDAGGVNMLRYERHRAGRNPSRITGIVIRDPLRFFEALPPVDSTLVRVATSAAVAH